MKARARAWTGYRNLGGHSGVLAYAIDIEAIAVRFGAGEYREYGYDAATTRRSHVEAMQALARAGSGLNTYINRHVGDAYAWRH